MGTSATTRGSALAQTLIPCCIKLGSNGGPQNHPDITKASCRGEAQCGREAWSVGSHSCHPGSYMMGLYHTVGAAGHIGCRARKTLGRS